MIDADSQGILLDVLQRESRSLLQYVNDAFPWITRAEQETLARLQKLIDEELQGAASLARFLQRHKVAVPPFGPYPVRFTSHNFVTLDSLLPLLVVAQRRAIADLEADVARLRDPVSRSQAHSILETKGRHLQALEQLVSAVPAGPAVRAAG
jgi:hypothetical protein